MCVSFICTSNWRLTEKSYKKKQGKRDVKADFNRKENKNKRKKSKREKFLQKPFNVNP